MLNIYAECICSTVRQQLEEAQEELKRAKVLLQGLQEDCNSKEARLQGLEDAERVRGPALSFT
jgi:hypothetical protein